MKSDGMRPQRVAEGLRARLAELIRKEADDPRLAALVITSVHMTDDLGIAKVNVRLLAGDDEKSRRRLMSSLGSMAGHLRRALGREVRMKRLPELRFYYDVGVDNERQVTRILDELSQGEEAPPAALPPSEAPRDDS